MCRQPQRLLVYDYAKGGDTVSDLVHTQMEKRFLPLSHNEFADTKVSSSALFGNEHHRSRRISSLIPRSDMDRN
jgi:hypothetical protein